jgi:hypothetical protein
MGTHRLEGAGQKHRRCGFTIGIRSGALWALEAQAGNPSYSGGRDQEDWDLKPALGK